jgi:hypothetical protein
MKKSISVSCSPVNFPQNTTVVGNLAIKPVTITKTEYETPKILKLVIGKKKNNIFCGCWQVANQEDSC